MPFSVPHDPHQKPACRRIFLLLVLAAASLLLFRQLLSPGRSWKGTGTDVPLADQTGYLLAEDFLLPTDRAFLIFQNNTIFVLNHTGTPVFSQEQVASIAAVCGRDGTLYDEQGIVPRDALIWLSLTPADGSHDHTYGLIDLAQGKWVLREEHSAALSHTRSMDGTTATSFSLGGNTYAPDGSRYFSHSSPEFNLTPSEFYALNPEVPQPVGASSIQVHLVVRHNRYVVACECYQPQQGTDTRKSKVYYYYTDADGRLVDLNTANAALMEAYRADCSVSYRFAKSVVEGGLAQTDEYLIVSSDTLQGILRVQDDTLILSPLENTAMDYCWGDLFLLRDLSGENDTYTLYNAATDSLGLSYQAEGGALRLWNLRPLNETSYLYYNVLDALSGNAAASADLYFDSRRYSVPAAWIGSGFCSKNFYSTTFNPAVSNTQQPPISLVYDRAGRCIARLNGDVKWTDGNYVLLLQTDTVQITNLNGEPLWESRLFTLD